MNRIYFDHNATTDILPQVKQAMLEAMSFPTNPSSIHFFGRKAKAIVEQVKKNILKSLNASPLIYEAVFTSSGTEANNLIIQGLSDYYIITSAIEHPSVLRIARNSKNSLKIEVDKNGLVDINRLEKLLSLLKFEKKLISIIYANNETGVIQNIDELAETIHKFNGIFHTDASQAYGKLYIDLSNEKIDALTISGHKFGGPQGIGVLIKKKTLNLTPIIFGGVQEYGLRPGTENVAAIYGLGAAIENLDQIIEKYTKLSSIRNLIEDKIILDNKKSYIYSKNVKRLSNTSSIVMEGVKSELQLIKFDLAGIAISAGSACSSGKIEPSHVLCAIGDNQADCAIRISLGLSNTVDEAENFVDVWQKIYSENNVRDKVTA